MPSRCAPISVGRYGARSCCQLAMTTLTDTSLSPPEFSYRPDLASAATSRDLRTAARHRWFYFPHSYSYRLVETVLDHWELPDNGVVADNFSGSGTTLLTARDRSRTVVGFDLSPLSVTVGSAKVAAYNESALKRAYRKICGGALGAVPDVPTRLTRAYTDAELREIFALLRPISSLQRVTRRFYVVALLSALRGFSRAVPDGGWFRWKDWPDRSLEIRDAFKNAVSGMTADVQQLNWSEAEATASVRLADARRLPLGPSCVDGLITSPPYANRHDYSRVFHIELLLLGESEQAVTKLRHRSIRSHVEARLPRGFMRRLESYVPPNLLKQTLGKLPADADKRVERFLNGYFEDLYLSLLEVARVLRPGGRAAYVVGNVRHAGVMVPVDLITADLAAQAGLAAEQIWVVRERGNAAQQMGRYGRQSSRESVVLLSGQTEA